MDRDMHITRIGLVSSEAYSDPQKIITYLKAVLNVLGFPSAEMKVWDKITTADAKLALLVKHRDARSAEALQTCEVPPILPPREYCFDFSLAIRRYDPPPAVTRSSDGFKWRCSRDQFYMDTFRETLDEILRPAPAKPSAPKRVATPQVAPKVAPWSSVAAGGSSSGSPVAPATAQRDQRDPEAERATLPSASVNGSASSSPKTSKKKKDKQAQEASGSTGASSTGKGPSPVASQSQSPALSSSASDPNNSPMSPASLPVPGPAGPSGISVNPALRAALGHEDLSGLLSGPGLLTLINALSSRPADAGSSMPALPRVASPPLMSAPPQLVTPAIGVATSYDHAAAWGLPPSQASQEICVKVPGGHSIRRIDIVAEHKSVANLRVLVCQAMGVSPLALRKMYLVARDNGRDVLPYPEEIYNDKAAARIRDDDILEMELF